MTPKENKEIVNILGRIASALEKQAGSEPPVPEFENCGLHIWKSHAGQFQNVRNTPVLPLDMLIGLDYQADILLQNTRQFAQGFPANNALLWGARGTGKSALVKAVYRQIAIEESLPFNLIEIQREDLEDTETILDILSMYRDRRFVLFCDDLSFDEGESRYKSLKSVLEGGVLTRPDNVLFYATSNRRHLMPRQMIENEASSAIHPGEAVEEKVSLSDRFGLWLGFYNVDQDAYLEMIRTYCSRFGLDEDLEKIENDALCWARTRGNRSGRVAWQFIQDIAGRKGKALNAYLII